jgi:hypothetical protein
MHALLCQRLKDLEAAQGGWRRILRSLLGFGTKEPNA